MSRSRAEASRPSGQAGFTLIEVVIALAIAALGLGALVASVGQGLQNVGAANLYIEATRRAQSRLDSAPLTDPIKAGVTTGDDGGGFAWRMAIAPVGSRPAPKGSVKDALTLYDMTVTISWKDGRGQREVSVQTERMGRLAHS